MNREWIISRNEWLLNRFYKKITHNNLSDKYFRYPKEILDFQETNTKLRKLIMAEKPFMAGRFGNTELQTMVSYQPECINAYRRHKYQDKLVRDSGFFYKTSNDIKSFVNLMMESCSEVDLLGCWHIEMEDYFIRKFCNDAIVLGKLGGLEPWNVSASPWSSLLKGKKVVFVHPFEKTIKHQLENIDKIFSNKEIFPACEVRIVRAVQTLAGNSDGGFEFWFDALDYMFNEVMSEEFDIAIIGCGAYGFPLAAKIKKAGRSAIHLGGATQLFFGIKGKRWDSHPHISGLYNDYWIYPLEEDRIEGYKEVEKGCYW